MADKPADEIRGKVNPAVGIIAIVLFLAAIGAVILAVKFIAGEQERNQQAWQIRLGIVADSRTQAVSEWADRNFASLGDLAENASLQLYLTELSLASPQEGTEQVEGGYLRNLLVTTAERAGFTPPVPAGEVPANVEQVGVAGIGLVNAQGQAIISTPGMPPLSNRVRVAVAKALTGEPALIDVYMGASNLPTIGFVLPIFAIQDDSRRTEGIGAVIGIRVVGNDLFDRLQQPGETGRTAETFLVRAAGSNVEYLSPLADGTRPLKRALARDTPRLAAAIALKNPGSFSIGRDYAGTDVLTVSRPLAGLPWVLVRNISQAEALSATNARFRTVFIVFVLIIIGVGVTVVAVWRHGTSLRAAAAAEKYRIAAERFENMSRFLKVVTDSQPTEIVTVDGETRYTFANQQAARQVNLTPDDMLDKTMASVIGPVKAKVFARINREVLEDHESQTHLHHFEDEDEHRVVRSVHVPLEENMDHSESVLLVLDDLTALTREKERAEEILRNLVNTLVSVVDRRDPYSAHHSTRVAEVARNICNEMGATELEARTVDIAGSLMNLGKIFVPSELLTKTDALSDEERARLAGSYDVSVDLLEDVVFEGPVVETIRQIGENWDGSGRLGLKGGEILATARTLAVANAFVGMISPRAYRNALTFEKVSNLLLEQSGTRFDRKPVSALINFLENRDGMDRWSHFRDTPSGNSQ